MPPRVDVLTQIIPSINDVPAQDWNALNGAEQPFLRHEFLHSLEASACVGTESGWEPCHIGVYDRGELVGAMPLYRKFNPWGEFVFDWAWSDAYRQTGLSYYPKLVSAVPFTPATGPRLLCAPQQDPSAMGETLVSAAIGHAQQTDASSLHVLFPTAECLANIERLGMMVRKDCQFHWHNRGYADFNDFLGELTASKRKKLKRERRRVSEAGIRFRALSGHELTPQHWHRLMPLYSNTFWRRGRDPYLNEEFFVDISSRLPEHIVVFIASHADQVIATAICFRSDDTLYGRYWGSSGRYHSLHFETCYYQGIEYCIDNKLARFEPGTQGEHKISRGFVPTETWSAHWLSHPQFARAIDDYLLRERDYMDDYIDVVSNHVPYRKNTVDDQSR